MENNYYSNDKAGVSNTGSVHGMCEPSWMKVESPEQTNDNEQDEKKRPFLLRDRSMGKVAGVSNTVASNDSHCTVPNKEEPELSTSPPPRTGPWLSSNLVVETSVSFDMESFPSPKDVNMILGSLDGTEDQGVREFLESVFQLQDKEQLLDPSVQEDEDEDTQDDPTTGIWQGPFPESLRHLLRIVIYLKYGEPDRSLASHALSILHECKERHDRNEHKFVDLRGASLREMIDGLGPESCSHIFKTATVYESPELEQMTFYPDHSWMTPSARTATNDGDDVRPPNPTQLAVAYGIVIASQTASREVLHDPEQILKLVDQCTKDLEAMTDEMRQGFWGSLVRAARDQADDI